MKGLVMRYAAPVLFDLVTGQVQHAASNGCLHIDQCIMTNSYNSLPCVGVWPTWLTMRSVWPGVRYVVPLPSGSL